MKRRKLSLRLISLLLCFVMLGLSSPIVIAEEAEIQTQETQPPSSKDGATSTNELQEPEQTEAATESLVASTSSSTQISDGLYKIKDVASGLYLEVIGGATASGTGLQLWGARTGADEARQFFAIEQIGSDGMFVYYTLRPQVNPSLGLTIEMGGGSVTVSTLADDPLGDESYDQLIVLNGTMNSCQIQGGGEGYKFSLCVTSTVTAGATVSATEIPSLIRNFSLIPQTTITSGVYRIKNVANNNYLNLPYTTNQTLGALNVTSFTDSEAFMRNQLFKVSLVENIDGTAYYTIRSMVDNSIGLWLEYLMVNTTTLATTDDSLGEYGISIVATEGGYLIQGGMPDCKANLAAPATFANGNAVFASGDATATTSKWVFEEYTTPIHGITWKAFDSLLMIGNTFQYKAMMYSSTIGQNGPVTFSVTDQYGNPTSAATINANTGYLSTSDGGLLRITASAGENVASTWDAEILLESSIAYTIKNDSLKWCIVPSSHSNFIPTVVNAIDQDDSYFLWEFEYMGSGYYRIKSSVTEKYLYASSTVVENATVYFGSYSTNGTDAINNQYLWKIETDSIGRVKIQNKLYESSGYYLNYYVDSYGDYCLVHNSIENATRWWRLEPLMLNLNVLHDQAFVDRYSIEGYENVLAIAFGNNSRGISYSSALREKFGIRVNINYITENHSSYPVHQQCAKASDFNDLCESCKKGNEDDPINDCSVHHHKNHGKFLETISNKILKNSTSMDILFTGHAACDVSNNIHISYAGGVTWTHVDNELGYSGIVILSKQFNNITISNNSKNGLIGVMFHETIHDFGLEHCQKVNACIMRTSADSDDVGKNLDLCEDCSNLVQSRKLWLYNHG